MRFGRPTEGHLVASKIADIPFRIWKSSPAPATDWIGLSQTLDWTPEMQLGFHQFGKEPFLRVSSFAAARRASLSLGLPFIGPHALVRPDDPLGPMFGSKVVTREVWCITHETRKESRPIQQAKDWLRDVFADQANIDANLNQLKLTRQI